MNKSMYVIGRRYIVEPGDGTRYDFSILDVPHGVPGVGAHALSYFTLVIHSPGNGAAEFSRDEKMSNGVLDCACPKMPGVQRYTVAAALLAAFELVRGQHINDAAVKMLNAGEYL